MLDQKSIFNISNNTDFEVLTLEVFKHQFKKNSVYRSFCDLLYIHPSSISSIEEIPYLPIQFFKTHKVLSSKNDIQTTFKSSGTTGSIVSKHYITDIELYTSSFRSCFQHVYGNVQDYVILALLPSYLERTNSSLVYMVNDFINQSNHQESGFYLNNYEQLAQTLRSLDASGKKVLLLGVSFALLALIESHKFDLNHTIVMETGGMKGRRKELI